MMISNYVIESQINELKKRKYFLSDRKVTLIAEVKKFGVTKNQAYKANTKGVDIADEPRFEARNKLCLELLEIENEFHKINTQVRDLARKNEADRNIGVIKIFGEIFTPSQMGEIKDEAKKRMAGESPNRLNFSFDKIKEDKSSRDEYKKLAKEYVEKVIEIRILLTGIIEKGCKQFGDAEFLKVMSPLNRLVIPIKELTKIKLKNYL